jgi:hypothetical protein
MHVSAAPCRPHAARGANPGRWPALRVAAALDLAKLSDKAYLDKAARRFQMGAYDSVHTTLHSVRELLLQRRIDPLPYLCLNM